MAPAPQYIAQLLHKYLDGTLSEQEQAELKEWLSVSHEHRRFVETLGDDVMLGKLVAKEFSDEQEGVEAMLLQRTKSQLEFSQPVIQRMHFLRRWWAAASIIILLGGSAYFWIASQKNTHPANVTAQTDIVPGKKGAVLTLADGSQLVLDSLGNGVIAMQGGTAARIINGSLVYDGKEDAAVYYNTISTPKGRQFQLTLPDGTMVWLNAASSLRYPTFFTGKDRKVEMTGEAYFEVAKNKEMPFRVQLNNKAEVKVLGTHFDINAYANETSINTTLIEGSVQVSATSSGNYVTLKPGQQAQITQAGGPEIEVVDNPDIGKVVAWKNGLFNFSDASLEEVMRQLERWYDIEVVYEKDIPQKTFYGKLTRDISLQGLLRILERTGVRFRVEDRKLIVLPTGTE
ncbi:FecR family protein [Chitinophaga niabensis]|uniref:FecR protein n=1 Tax=Chitinophaga niabensis TaxID=536979 RepID=A0A1N6H329_9BACT|nr:FecR family protein [Chitinophaga niabensis]SIO14184.1 FecR protein [Chitinophaga niabensis]